jgi:hypothetical protein
MNNSPRDKLVIWICVAIVVGLVAVVLLTLLPIPTGFD